MFLKSDVAIRGDSSSLISGTYLGNTLYVIAGLVNVFSRNCY